MNGNCQKIREEITSHFQKWDFLTQNPQKIPKTLYENSLLWKFRTLSKFSFQCLLQLFQVSLSLPLKIIKSQLSFDKDSDLKNPLWVEDCTGWMSCSSPKNEINKTLRGVKNVLKSHLECLFRILGDSPSSKMLLEAAGGGKP